MKSAEQLSKRPVTHMNERKLKEITEDLNHILANEYALFTKTLNFHWNVTGSRFHSLHKFLEGEYQSLLKSMDEIAERVRILGETPCSTVREMMDHMDLNEKSGRDLSANEMIRTLLGDHQKVQNLIHETLEKEGLFASDPGTEDFLTELLEKHEKESWMLKSHLD